MRILLVLTSCVGLAFFAGAAQHDEQDNNQGKKKGGDGNAPSQQVAAPQTGKVYKAGPGGGPHNRNFQQPNTATNYNATGKKAQKWQGPVTGQNQTNFSGHTKAQIHNNDLPAVQSNGNAAFKTKLGKTKFSSQTNVDGNFHGNFQKKHFNLTNNPNPKYQAVKFNGNYQIAGAHKWKGSKYVVFQNYHPEWHDQGWWHHHHNHITFVFGAPYYWDSGYWYPAWGYNPGANYYYDGPIYASNPEYDPGQVVANVQAALQEQGYYQGDVDGILGPQTRAALAEYQSAQGLEPTGTVDEPTLETLGMV
jgi:hypothetical protein